MAAAAHRSILRASSSELGMLREGVRGSTRDEGTTGAIVGIVAPHRCETGSFENVLVPALASERTITGLEVVWLGGGPSKGMIRGTLARLAGEGTSTDACDARRTRLTLCPTPGPTDSGGRKRNRTSGVGIIL